MRRAVYQAIDVEAIRQEVMHGLSAPTGLLIPPGANGWSEELDQRLPYDPATAQALLAEAGYPHGFAVTLDCPEGRYVNDVAICQAVGDMLGRVGIAVTVNAAPMRRHTLKIQDDGPISTCWAGSPLHLMPSLILRSSSAAAHNTTRPATLTRAWTSSSMLSAPSCRAPCGTR